MTLYLLRHGDALETASTDAQRPLSPAGEEQARTVATYLRTSRRIPEAIRTSPLTRAVQMSVIIREELNVADWAPTEFLVPGTDHRQLVRELNGIGSSPVLLVGHEPHLQVLASLLIRGDRLGSYPFRKGSLACLETGSPVVAGAGRLEWLVAVEQMKQPG